MERLLEYCDAGCTELAPLAPLAPAEQGAAYSRQVELLVTEVLPSLRAAG